MQTLRRRLKKVNNFDMFLKLDISLQERTSLGGYGI